MLFRSKLILFYSASAEELSIFAILYFSSFLMFWDLREPERPRELSLTLLSRRLLFWIAMLEVLLWEVFKPFVCFLKTRVCAAGATDLTSLAFLVFKFVNFLPTLSEPILSERFLFGFLIAPFFGYCVGFFLNSNLGSLVLEIFRLVLSSFLRVASALKMS